MKKFLFAAMVFLLASFAFSEGMQDGSEPPPFPYQAPYANEYFSEYQYLTEGVQEEFGLLIVNVQALDDEVWQQTEYKKGFDALSAKYIDNYEKISEFCERMVTENYMTADDSEKFLEDLSNCNIWIFITGAMMYLVEDSE